MTIKKCAVIGSGVMGASIAAHIANSGTEVLLFDIVPEGENDRTALAKGAIAKLLKADPAPLTHKRKAKLITPCNLEDDLDKLGQVDWIIEAVLERIDVKHSVYKTLDENRKEGSIVSSNTSTIPLKNLIEGQSEAFQKDFLITHFFNPPRYMRLLELVAGEHTRADALEAIKAFGDVNLGKGVVMAKDTPGFIANRIGCFWLQKAMIDAFEKGVSVEEADAQLSRPIGVPKTGVFGLMDLIGIDLLPLIGEAFKNTLPADDAFVKAYNVPELVQKMIDDGYTGRKGKGGFYTLEKSDDGKKTKMAKDFASGEYKPAEKVKPGDGRDLKAFMEAHDYAWGVMKDVLAYTASLIPEMADDIYAVDQAMKTGYNWKYGPFELIDKMGVEWFAEQLEDVPAILAHKKPLYEEGKYLGLDGAYHEVQKPEGSYILSDVTRGTSPIFKNPSARLWDIGDGIAALEFTSKMNALDPMSFELINKAIDEVEKNYKGLVFYNDGDNFCVGANIGVLLFAANVAAWKMIEGVIKEGQDTYMRLKYAPFPVVVAPSGMALGGGCELSLHADAVCAHVEYYTGLVEVGVGIVPGWGGCKEMLLRGRDAQMKKSGAVAAMGKIFAHIPVAKSFNAMPVVTEAFKKISTAQIAKSADEAKDMLILNDKSKIVMNRERVLPEAKTLCLELANGYQAPEPAEPIHLPGKTARTALKMAVQSFVKQGKATPHDEVVSMGVAEVLSGGSDNSILTPLSEQDLLDLELRVFMELAQHPDSLARIEHMLETGKPLRN